MCASTMQDQATGDLLFGAGFRVPIRHDFDERIAFPLQPLAFGRIGAAGREGAVGQFGLLPDWVDDAKGGPKYGRYCYNARSESVFEKPSFRQAILKRRAVLPVNAFYEFPDKEMPVRRRFKIRRQDGQPFWLAAIWERNQRYGVESVSILTGEPMELLAPFHSRSPILLEAGQLEAWLDPGLQAPERIRGYLKTADSNALVLDEEPWGKEDQNLELFR